MCQSVADGGRRCAARCRTQFHAALTAWRAEGPNPASDEALSKAAYDLARSVSGRDDVRAFVHAADSPMVATVICSLALKKARSDALVEGEVPGCGEAPTGQSTRPSWLPGPPVDQIVHVDEERSLTYTWNWLSDEPRDRHDLARGWIVSKLKVHHTTPDGAQHPVGYLKVVYTSEEFINHAFPDVFAWATATTGTLFPDRDLVSPQQFWLDAHQKSSTAPASNGIAAYRLTLDDAPESLKDIARDVKVVEKDLKRTQQQWLRDSATPIVDFSRVYGPDGSKTHKEGHPGSFRGQGVGTQMYVCVAKALGEAGMVLGASGAQTEEAQALWTRLKADPDLPTKTRRRRKGTQMVLDFRSPATTSGSSS